MSYGTVDPQMTVRSSAVLWLIALGLSMGPAVTNGLARFAYGLLLPDMQADLGWTYAEAGWINTANAIGYLIGAIYALATIGRHGAVRLFVWGMALTTLALALSALSRDLYVLSFWRIVAGIGGAPVFIAGGALAAALFTHSRTLNALVIAVYFGGGGLGMLVTAMTLPAFMEWFGPSGWPLAWIALGIFAFVAFIPSWLAAEAAPQPTEASQLAGVWLPVRAMLPALGTYFFFGVGYVIYITFIVAWLRSQGAPVELVTMTWAVMGLAVMISPFIWGPVLSYFEGGNGMALVCLIVGIGILLPISLRQPEAVLASAALFGVSFFMVPTAVTSFSRKNLPRSKWGAAIALFTVVFSVGQIIGPVGAGMLTDLTANPDLSLIAAGLCLLAAAALATQQRALSVF